MNPNDVEIVRVYTREHNGTVADITPHVNPNSLNVNERTFDVVVEAEAGNTITLSGSPYEIRIQAFDFTTGTLAPAPFQQSNGRNFVPGANPLTDFPQHTEVFHVALNAPQANAVSDHIMKYFAYLVTPPLGGGLVPQIISIAESPLFIVIVGPE